MRLLQNTAVVPSLALGLLLSVGSPTLHAQGPEDLVPENALLAIGWAGADALEPVALRTALGEIVAEPRVQELSDALIPAIESLLRQEIDSPEEREGLLLVREALGEIWSHPLTIAVTGLSVVHDQPIPEVALCLRAGDGAVRIYETIEHLREREGAPAEPYPSAASARRVALPDAPVPLIYGVERGCFFIALTDAAAEATLGRIRGEGTSITGNPGFGRAWDQVVGDSTPMKWIYVDGTGCREMCLRMARDAEANLPPLVAAALSEDGLGRLGPLLISVGLEGKGFRRAAMIGWRSDAEPGPGLDEGTLALVPRDTSFMSYEDQDVAGLVRGLKDFVGSADPEAARQLRSFQALADGFLGFRIEEELLASLGRRFLVFEEPTTSGILPGVCLVLRPDDSDTVQNCVRRLTTSLGAVAGTQGVGVAVQQRGGISFIETSGAPVPIAPAWATRGPHLFITLHPTVLEEVLHRVDAADGRERSILTNPDFVAARQRIGPIQHGIFYTDTASVVRDLYPIALPLLQAGVAALGGNVSGLSAMQLPPPYMINERMFGDIHGYRRTGDGFLWEAHGPFPFTVPDLGSMAMGALVAGVAPWIGVRQEMAADRAMPELIIQGEEHGLGGEHGHDHAHDDADRPPIASLGFVLNAIESNRAEGKSYTNSADALEQTFGVPHDMLYDGSTARFTFPPKPIPGTAKDGTLLLHTKEAGPSGYWIGVVGGSILNVSADRLEKMKKESGWVRRAEL